MLQQYQKNNTSLVQLHTKIHEDNASQSAEMIMIIAWHLDSF